VGVGVEHGVGSPLALDDFVKALGQGLLAKGVEMQGVHGAAFWA
jgi:hypothetical protein